MLHLQTARAQSRRLRVRQRPVQAAIASDESLEDESELSDDYDSQPQPQQYYTPEPPPARSTQAAPASRYVVSSSDDYNGLYGQPTVATPRQRVDYSRPTAASAAHHSIGIAKSKENQTKAPPVQTIRNYNKVNDDGSFTFGYEAADGSFKEETRGTDCVVRGKYGYVDPDGNKREFTYVSGNPCDPAHPDETSDDERNGGAASNSAEDPNEPENVPVNFPRRPVKPSNRPQQQQQYVSRPVPTTTHAPPTTVFQNTYASNAYNSRDQSSDEQDEDEQPDTIQLLQPQRPVLSRAQPIVQQYGRAQEEVTIRQRPRITVAQTTPSPLSAFLTPTRPVQPVSITPRPTYRVPGAVSPASLQTQPPATTYRPAVQFVTQKPAYQRPVQQQQQFSFTSKPTPVPLSVEPLTKSTYVSSRKPIDFAVEFQKFQQQHNVLQPSTAPPRQLLQTQPTQRPFKPSPIHNIELPNGGHPTSNPIYESQLVFDPSTGQYDSNLFQQLPQSDGDFTLSNRHQPYVQLPYQAQSAGGHLVSLEQQLRQQPSQHQPQTAATIYHQRQPAPTRSPLQFQPAAQFSQQVYQKEQENNQVLSSQQLFAQQQELQQQQLHQDRLIAAAKLRQPQLSAPRFQQQPQQQQQSPFQPQPQGFYYVQAPQQQQQPHQTSGQIDAFLRGHNIDF